MASLLYLSPIWGTCGPDKQAHGGACGAQHGPTDGPGPGYGCGLGRVATCAFRTKLVRALAPTSAPPHSTGFNIVYNALGARLQPASLRSLSPGHIMGCAGPGQWSSLRSSKSEPILLCTLQLGARSFAASRWRFMILASGLAELGEDALTPRRLLATVESIVARRCVRAVLRPPAR
jgi:hypothetical protein